MKPVFYSRNRSNHIKKEEAKKYMSSVPKYTKG